MVRGRERAVGVAGAGAVGGGALAAHHRLRRRRRVRVRLAPEAAAVGVLRNAPGLRTSVLLLALLTNVCANNKKN